MPGTALTIPAASITGPPILHTTANAATTWNLDIPYTLYADATTTYTATAANDTIIRYIIQVQAAQNVTTAWANAGTGNGWAVEATGVDGWWPPTATTNVAAVAVTVVHGNPDQYVWAPRILTPAEQEAQRVRIAAVKEAEDTARARAEELLNRYLREDQRVTLQEKGWFLVEAKSGTRYRIYRGRSHNVKLLDTSDREVASLCAHPKMVVPEADTMLSQKLMLELAEDRFLAMANKRHLMERRLAA